MIPNQGLARDASGQYIQNTGFAEAPVLIRDHDTGGVIADIWYPSVSTWYNVSKIPRISLWVQFTLGNLTDVTVAVFFGSLDATIPYNYTLPLYTAGSRVLNMNAIDLKYKLTLNANIIIPIINPGATGVRFYIDETHAADTDNSKLGLHCSRSYLNHDIGAGIPNV